MVTRDLSLLLKKGYPGDISQTVKLIFACPDNLFRFKIENKPCANHTATLFVRVAPGQKNELTVCSAHTEISG